MLSSARNPISSLSPAHYNTMEEVCVGAIAALAVAAVGVTAAAALGDKLK